MIGFGSRCVYQREGQRLLRELGIPEDAHYAEYPSTEMIRHMVRCGLGIAYVPEIAIKRELEEGTVVRLPLPCTATMTHGLIWLRDRVLNTPSKVFRDRLLDFFDSLKQ